MAMEDLEQVLEIERASFSTPWTRSAFEMEVDGSNRYALYWVARNADKIVGYLGTWLILNEIHVTNIAVKPDFRRQGIAEQLLGNLFNQAKSRNIDAITLEVRVSNHSAQKLYQKLGFQMMGVRPKYYQNNNEDALIMWKILNKQGRI